MIGRLLVSLLLLAAPPALAQTFTGSMSGSWWDPTRSGEGQLLAFETVGARSVAFLSYFTYDASGRAMWLVGNADYAPGATSISIPLFTGSGARFGGAFRTGDVRIAAAGTATLEFVSCAQMRLRYAGAESFDLALQRLVGPLTGVDCPSGAPPRRSASSTFGGPMSGAWWNAARSGEGQVVAFETVGARNVVFFAYFTYDADGSPAWLVGNTDYRTGAASLSIPLFRAAGARFGRAFRPTDVRLSPAGHAVLDYDSCSTMRLRYVGVEALAFDLTRLAGPLQGADCAPLPVQAETVGDQQLRALLPATGQAGNAARSRVLPSIRDPLPQLGKLLFFSKALSGRLDTACASCHHPALAGADGLSLPVGTGAASQDVLGPGRRLAAGGFSVGRNANTYFNVALHDRGLFWDSRVESLAGTEFGNGAGSGIRTPETVLGTADARAGPTLPAAQARFPIPSAREMRGDAYPGLDDSRYRDRIAARLGNYGAGAGELAPSGWLDRFRAAFGDGSAEQLITFDNIALALAEYQRSAVFVDNPWSRYVRGDNEAISPLAKEGALSFFRPVAQGGAQCSQCHKGDFFTDERHHVVAFAQIGSGAGDGLNGTDDFGRARQTALESDRYRYRTPSLLNVELTAPYGHAGAYADLHTVFTHYLAPAFLVNNLIVGRTWCALPQFIAIADCAGAAPDVSRNSLAALAQLAATRDTAPAESLPVPVFGLPEEGMRAFLQGLTDPCLRDRACYGAWIPAPSEAPDGHQLNAVDAAGAPL